MYLEKGEEKKNESCSRENTGFWVGKNVQDNAHTLLLLLLLLLIFCKSPHYFILLSGNQGLWGDVWGIIGDIWDQIEG